MQYREGVNAVLWDWMDLFCDMIRLHLLVQKTPKEKIIQVNQTFVFERDVRQIYSAAYYAQTRQDPPQHYNVCTIVTNFSQNPIPRFQKEMQSFTFRIRQVYDF